jgi:hypothetical protein
MPQAIRIRAKIQKGFHSITDCKYREIQLTIETKIGGQDLQVEQLYMYT